MQSNDSMSNNQILSVFQKGYELNSRVIRPARVLVVKNS
jgi:molecular chaperone GrpE